MRKAEEFLDQQPEIREKYEKEMNEVDDRSEEEIILEKVEHYLFNSTFVRPSKLQLNILNPESENVKNFFARQDVKEVLKMDNKKRELIVKYFGKGYLKKAQKDC